MGMRDKSGIYSDAQAVTNTGDTASTNVYSELNAASADIGLSGELWLNVQCQTTATSGGSATVQAVLQDSADNSSFADVMAGPVLAVANVIAGAVLWQNKLPLGLRQYTRVVYRVGTAALTGGAFNAWISTDVQSNIARPSGFTVA